MTPTQSMIHVLQTEITLLHRLLSLSKHELQLLESSNYDDLPQVVSEKKEVVVELERHIASFDNLLQENTNLLEQVSDPERVLLESLKEQGAQLLELISEIDSENRLRLENKRSQVIQDSRQLRQEFRLNQAYGPLPSPMSRFSQDID